MTCCRAHNCRAWLSSAPAPSIEPPSGSYEDEPAPLRHASAPDRASLWSPATVLRKLARHRPFHTVAASVREVRPLEAGPLSSGEKPRGEPPPASGTPLPESSHRAPAR